MFFLSVSFSSWFDFCYILFFSSKNFLYWSAVYPFGPDDSAVFFGGFGALAVVNGPVWGAGLYAKAFLAKAFLGALRSFETVFLVILVLAAFLGGAFWTLEGFTTFFTLAGEALIDLTDFEVWVFFVIWIFG
jgi:hypothetical protein